jgi:hypothetical protein
LIAQSHGIPDAISFSTAKEENRHELVDIWRAAVVKLILTPAPDALAVDWKRKRLRENNDYTGIKSERIERAIDEDVAFLAAHPFRKSNSETMARRREFKEAMRQRIRDVAASRNLSDEDIEPALTLKHQEIANFSEEHGVSLEWLLAPLP